MLADVPDLPSGAFLEFRPGDPDLFWKTDNNQFDLAGRHFLICVHITHDRCCGESGSTAVDEMRALGLKVIPVSHLGGDRFGANVLILPEGILLGRVDEDYGVLAQGNIPPGSFRGRAGATRSFAVAEEAVRRRTKNWRINATVTIDFSDAEQGERFEATIDGQKFTGSLSNGEAIEGYFTCSAKLPSLRVPICALIDD
jgi:hypothetical protein